MTQSMWMSFISSVLLFVGGILVSRGVLSNTALTTLIDSVNAAIPLVVTFVGAIVPIALTIWGILTNTPSAQLKAVENMPDVYQIVVAPTASSGMRKLTMDSTRPKIVVAPSVPKKGIE